MRLRARADSLRLEADENGWELHATTDDGDEVVLNIQGVAFEFAGSDCLAELLAWRREGQEAEPIAGQVTVDEMLRERYGD